MDPEDDPASVASGLRQSFSTDALRRWIERFDGATPFVWTREAWLLAHAELRQIHEDIAANELALARTAELAYAAQMRAVELQEVAEAYLDASTDDVAAWRRPTVFRRRLREVVEVARAARLLVESKDEA